MSEEQPSDQLTSSPKNEATARSADSSSDSDFDPNVIFDKLYKEYLAKPLVGYLDKPTFKPVIYNAEEAPCKFRRLIVRDHERSIQEHLRAETTMTDKEVNRFAAAASYYPGGSKHQRLKSSPLTYLCTPPRISSGSSDASGSPEYLFKDLPTELPKNEPEKTSSPFLKSPESLELLPKTPDRRNIDHSFETPRRSAVEVINHLSPALDKLVVESELHHHETESMVTASEDSILTDTSSFQSGNVSDVFESPTSPVSSLSSLSHIVHPSTSPVSVDINFDCRLLEGYVFLCAKPFDRLNYDMLKGLLEYNGAQVIRHPNLFEAFENKIRICLMGEPRYWNNEEANTIQPVINHLYDSTIEEAIIAGVPEILLE